MHTKHRQTKHRNSNDRGPRNFPALALVRSATPATLTGMEPAHVTLSGDLSGEYVVEDHQPDGRLLLRPDLSVRAMLARHGERQLTPAEFEQHLGGLPTDGEG